MFMACGKPIVFEVLNALLHDCLKFFSQNCNQDSHEAILSILQKIDKNLHFLNHLAENVIRKHVHKYDASSKVQANGFRSLLSLLESLLLIMAKILKVISTDCSNLFFRANEHLDKLELCSDILHQLRALFYYSQIIISLTPDGNLFLDEENSAPLLHDCEILAKSCFYGSLHGFQYTGALQSIMQSFSTLVAQYNDLHEPPDAWSWVKSALNSSRYVISPELRGEKLEKLYNSGDVGFMRKFWFLPEQGIVQAVPSLVGTGVKVNRIFKIQPKPFTIPNLDNEDHVIKIATRLKPVQARLLSYVLREGQDDLSSPSTPDVGFDTYKMKFGEKKPQAVSNSLIFFCHGGGFISLTSKSFEFILRDWSKETDCPIFCVDYSLAPESPFPEAFEECFYAYAWALKNSHFLGTTAEKVVFVGDSAGGNLILSVALRCGALGLRVPDSLVTIYPACVVQPSVSPARLLSVMDPLLPLGVLSGCLSAYAGVETTWVKRKADEDPLSVDNSEPTCPSLQPMRMKYLSNLRKDFEENILRLGSENRWKPDKSTWWDEEFYHLNLVSGENGDKAKSNKEAATEHDSDLASVKAQFDDLKCSLNSPDTCFKIKFLGDFEPLKSKFLGDNFHIGGFHKTKNAFMSPVFASDEMMSKLPHVDIVACEFDPLLDDSVFLAKRLETLKKSYSLHVIKGLPHGILSFQFTQEAVDTSSLCLKLIQQALAVSRS